MLTVLIVAAIGVREHAPSVEVTIVDRGASAWTIAYIGGAPELRGANEIQDAIERMSGAKLPIVFEGTLPRKQRSKTILIRPAGSNTPEESFAIRSNAAEVEIAGGGSRGALYGCYAFLEDVLGCRWYTRTIAKYPRLSTIRIPRLEIHERPAFEYREPYFAEAFSRDWAVRNRVNGNAMDLDDSVGGKVSYGKFVHTFSELVPPEKYFATHPEYFSLVKGQRQSGYAQLCLTNPDVLKLVIAKVADWIRENPKATIFSVSQNDAYLNCECDNCKAVEREERAPSGPLLRFVNKVADAIGQDHPNVLIDTLAYQWSEKPPLHERPHKNVRIRIAPIGACVAHALDGCAANKAPYKNLLDWSRTTNQLYIWHYSTDFANYLLPLPDIDEIAGDMKLFKRHGVVGVFSEGSGPQGGGGAFAELKSYLLAKLMWNPDRPIRPIMADYLDGVYGKAAPDIQRWLDMLQSPARTKHIDAFIYDPPTAPYLSDELLAQGMQLFDHAAAAVAGEAVQGEQVRKARLWLDYVRLMRSGLRYDAASAKFVPQADPGRDALARHVLAEIDHFGITSVSEGEPLSAFKARLGVSPRTGRR